MITAAANLEIVNISPAEMAIIEAHSLLLREITEICNNKKSRHVFEFQINLL